MASVAAILVKKGYPVDIITSSPVLAAEGVRDKFNFYTILGITVTHNNPDEKNQYL